ncbi:MULTISPECIES: phosphatidylserine decarboxylase [unclassified Clostridium]|uniref:phosphatidylserine decarboxylase n=1 Tax=unclassified Clostridium TaxID=2614128 RepID=UPI003F8EF053
MIKYYNRRTNNYDIEKIAGEKYLNWTYSSPIGMNLLEIFIKKKFFSKIYGFYCDRKISVKKVDKFINNFQIDMSLCENQTSDFKCFNDFFARKLKKEARPIKDDNNILISPGDGKILAYESLNLNSITEIKGINYSFYELINNNSLAKEYDNGTCLILRLCPTDYHRFHFIDNGVCNDTIKIDGFYYSVNPIALAKIPSVFCKNKREYAIFHSENFGDVIFMEVGATCVGSIIQTYNPNTKILKGSEKGYFKFGGSTVILFFKENTIKIDDDILNQSKLGYETSVIMGEPIGNKKIKVF